MDRRRISGFVLMEPLETPPPFLTFRARPEGRQGTVLLHTIPTGTLFPSERMRLKEDFEKVSSLRLEGILRPLEWIESRGELIIVSEDFNGLPIRTLLPEEGLAADRFLDLAVPIGRALEQLHQHRLLLGNISPDHILFDSDNSRVKFIRVGSAVGLKDIFIPRVIEQVLTYIAPEQTGRINRDADHRSDLYSLGVSFYEMLTGQPPFVSADPLELFYSHIARQPLSPQVRKPSLPEPLSRIVLKLMAKPMEERYQTAGGLLADLEECLRQLKEKDRIALFPLGRRDPSPPFKLPPLLLDREREIRSIQEVLDKVVHGAVEIVLFSGEPGIGKTALAEEFRRRSIEKHGYFISGRFEPFPKEGPYGPIIQAFQHWVQDLLRESEDRVQAWGDRLLTVLGPNARVVAELVPEMKRIIGDPPPVPELEPEENLHRFHWVFRQWVRAAADWDHPLLLFLDDLQWADRAGLHLIREIVTDPDLRFFSFVGAYRDTEVSEGHPILDFLKGMEIAGKEVAFLSPGPIGPHELNRILSEKLNRPPEISLPLAETVLGKTGGNPFFIHQFMQTLQDRGLLFRDAAGAWQWDLEGIRETEGTENVVQSLAERLRSLPSRSLRILQVGACIGSRFDAETIAGLLSRPTEEIRASLDEEVDSRILGYREGRYHFRHARYQEAVYALLSDREKEGFHYRIGMWEYGRTLKEERPGRIFFLADQLNRGRGCLASPEEKVRSAEINLQAGVRAKESGAFEAAAAYFSRGTALLEELEEPCWETRYPLIFSLCLEGAECQYLLRNFEEAEKLTEVAIRRAVGRRDLLRAYKIRIVLLTHIGRTEEAIRWGLKALELFKMGRSAEGGRLSLRWALFRLRRRLGKGPLERILDLPPLQDPDWLALHDLIPHIGTAAYYVRPRFFALLTVKTVELILQFGHPPQSAVTFMALAALLLNELGDYLLAFRIGLMALKLNRKLENRKTEARVLHTFAFFLQHWQKPARYDLDFYRQAYESATANGDLLFAGHSLTAAAQLRVWLCHPLDDIWEDLKRHRESIRRIEDPLIRSQYQQIWEFVQSLRGQPQEPFESSELSLNFSSLVERWRAEGNLFALCLALSPLVVIYYHSGLYEKALETALELDRYVNEVSRGSLLAVDHAFNFSLVLIALLNKGGAGKGKRIRALFKRQLKRLRFWAELCPENFRHKAELVEGEKAALEGRFQEALGFLQRAMEGAEANGFFYEEALACEKKALLLLSTGNETEARALIRRAYDCYRRWGSVASMALLAGRYPQLVSPETGAEGSKPAPSPERSPDIQAQMDLSTIRQISQAISGEIVLERLIRKILHIALVNAGAQRGFLILNREGRLTVEAGFDLEREEEILASPLEIEEATGLSQAVVHYVARSGKYVVLGDACEEGPFLYDPYLRSNRRRSILCLPFQEKGRLVGMLYMENNLLPQAFTEERLEVQRVMASQAAVALENARLFELATTDGLTQLYARRYFHLLLEREAQRAKRLRQPLALLLADIDDFKQCNDRFGHQVGDRVLKRTAEVIRRTCRAVDVAARYGGEEFVLLLPATDLPGALTAAEKLRQAVEASEVTGEEGGLRVTVSIGVSVFPDLAEEEEGLIRSADQALYAAKRSGKNRVCAGTKTAGSAERP